MLTKNLQVLKGTVIMFEVSQCFRNMYYNAWTTLDGNNDGGDDDGVEEADDDGSANKQ